MQAHNLRHLIVWPVAATTLLIAHFAFAEDNDPAAIEGRLKALETTPARSALLAAPAANARKAIKRVLDARAAGDAAHAVELAALADDWARLAANVVRAAELEQELANLQTQLLDLEQKRRRTETLLETTIAQRERSKQELSRLKSEKSGPSKAADKATPEGAVPVKPPDASAKSNATKQAAPTKANPAVRVETKPAGTKAVSP